MPADELQTVYIIDTNVLVNIRDEYGDSREIWSKLIEEIQAENVKIVRQVFDELERRFPDVFARLKAHKKDAQVPDALAYSAEVVAEVREIQQRHPGLYNQIGNTNSADPMMIAVAKAMGAVVVTDERSSGPGHQKRIPWVCTQRNVGWTNGAEFVRLLGF